MITEHIKYKNKMATIQLQIDNKSIVLEKRKDFFN